MSRGSLHAVPVKLTPKGDGRGAKPSGNGGIGALGTIPNGTVTVGYRARRPARADAPLLPGAHRRAEGGKRTVPASRGRFYLFGMGRRGAFHARSVCPLLRPASAAAAQD